MQTNRLTIAAALAATTAFGSATLFAQAPAVSIPASLALTAVAAPDDEKSSDRDRDGKYKSEELHRKDILWLLADVADRAASDEGWRRVSDWLSSKDRHRISDGLDAAKSGDYAKNARAFRQAWKSKYGSEFNAHKHMDDLKGVQVTFQDEGGRKIARAAFPPFAGMEAFEMRLQLEARDKWRIEIPNEVDAQEFIDGLQEGLRTFTERAQSLPDDDVVALNTATAVLVHSLSFEPGRATASKRQESSGRDRGNDRDANRDRERNRERDAADRNGPNNEDERRQQRNRDR